jgi:transcriptional regulator with XRE-family HTH domain
VSDKQATVSAGLSGIGDRIRTIREELDLSQTELAEAVGVSRGLVGQWETHKKQPGTDNLAALVRYTSVSADYILGLDPSHRPRARQIRQPIETAPKHGAAILTDGSGLMTVPDPESTAEPPEEVFRLLGPGARPTGKIRMPRTVTAARLQYEWEGTGREWFDIPVVDVESLPPAPPRPEPSLPLKKGG